MKFAKIRSRVLDKALQNQEFGALRMYLSDFKKEGEYFITPYNPYCQEWSLRSVLSDYFFNEPESEKIWKLAEDTIGHKHVDLDVIKVIEI